MILTLAMAAIPAPAEDTWEAIVPEGAAVRQVATGYQFTEGPIWTRSGRLLFSDIPGNTIHEWKEGGPVAIFRSPSRNTNGNNLDPQGRLVSCEHGSRTVTRTEKDGTLTTLAATFDGRRLNSPNDVVVHPDGTVFFTDPPYGIRPEQQELDFNGVFRLKDGRLEPIAKDFKRPNGIALSPDGSFLYVSDTEGRHIRRFVLASDGKVTGGNVWAKVEGEKPGVPDGLRVDRRGNVYCTGSGGVQVFTPSAKRLGTIGVPEVATNCAWGGADARSLFITAGKSVYRIDLKVPGLRY